MRSTGTNSSYDEQGIEILSANPGAVSSLQNNGIMILRREDGQGRVIWASE